ncbi:SNF2 domain-containing protein CLASSY 3-like [Hordeum vulgare subsp. vulgare]|uniref:SNF2 domain-containing protein CLASSY 3-like n=1 Tax=Hordeum vulgare subsp. vulgare TaxID=112509 RepID=UPI001D1A3C01|nr:SNF2 domain-containing protein CLASSY 3-like [Hordeum vulgare subsp. vulgare]
MVSARDHGRGADPLSDSEDSRARARKRPAASSPGCSRKVKKRRRESSSGAKGHGAVAGGATRSVDGRRKNKRLEAVRRPRSHHSSDDGWLRRSGHGGGDRARRDAAPARQVGAFAASSSRSRNGDRGKVAAKHAASVVSEDSVEEGDGEEMEGTSSDDNGRFGRRVRHDAAVASRNRSRSGGRRTRTVVTDDSGDDDEDEETGSSDDNDEESRDDEEEDVMKGTNTDGDSGDSDEEEEGVMRGMNKDDESDDNEEEEDVDSEDDDDAVMRRNNEGKSKENVDVMKGKNNENNNGNSNGRCKSVEKEAGGEDDGNSTHDDSSDANADEEESNDTTQTETEEEEEEEEEEESDEAGQDRRVASSRNGETGQDSTHDDSSDANADEEESNDTTQTETETEEEEATEEEEKEESDGAGQDRRVASSRNGETGQDPRVAPSSNGEASGRTRRAVDGLPRVGRRKFEGMWLVEEADTTTPPPGRGLSKRTRSHLSCSNKKLLKLGSVTKPVLLDTSSSGSESEPEEVVPPPQPSSWAAEDGSAGEGRRPAKKKTRRCWQQIAQGGRSENDNSDDPDDDRTPPRKARKGPSSSKPKIGASNRQQTAAKAGGKTHHGSSTNPRRFFKTRAANAADGRGLQDDICFQKSSLSHRKGKRQAEEDIPANDLLASIFDGIPSYLDGSAPADAQGGGCDTMPLVFKFGEEAEVKSEHDELEDQLWEDCDFALQDVNANAHSSEEVEESQGQDIPADQKTLCSQGKHDLVTNDQIGTWCRHCPFLLEIKYVMAPMGNCSAEREPTLARELNIDIINGILTTMGYEGEYVIGSHKSGPVWNLIPGVREDMFPHQQEAFEFLWKKLAGGIDIEQVKQIVETDALSGCVISHAPGTGKTRLAITFVQSYLELFPQCFPVIIAPKGMLDTWETEFRKWNVKIPFHVLSSSDIHWHGDMTVERLASNDKEFARKLSINSIDWNYMRALKLRSWAEGSSIVGLSYSLFRNLTKGEGNDADKVRQLLFQRPDLLILDEGHTPRNKETNIWKALAKVRTKKRIILSGTPFQNSFEELHSIMRLLLPGNDEATGFLNSLKLNSITDKRVDEIRKKLDPFVHIHNGDILNKSLKGFRESVVILNPLPSQKRILAEMEKHKGSTLDLEYKISLASVHPSLVAGMKNLPEEVTSVVDQLPLERLRLKPSEGVKTRFVYEVVRLCQALKERVLVFSQFLQPLDLIMEQLRREFNWTKGKEILVMSGHVSSKTRKPLMAAFNDMESEAKVMLASTKACGEGITLVGASRVVLLDVVWNPSVGRQAVGRAYRIGQQKVVHSYNLIAEGTQEKAKYDSQTKKDQMSKMLFSSEPQPVECNPSSEFISNDRILEKMTEDENMKEMFVDILPSQWL